MDREICTLLSEILIRLEKMEGLLGLSTDNLTTLTNILLTSRSAPAS